MLLQISWLDASWTRKLEFLDNDLWDFISGLVENGTMGLYFLSRGWWWRSPNFLSKDHERRQRRLNAKNNRSFKRKFWWIVNITKIMKGEIKYRKSKNDVDKGGRWSGDDLCAGQAGLGGSSATLSSHPYHTHHYTPYLSSLPYPPLHTIHTLLTIPTITVYHTYPPSYPPLHTYPHYHIQV